MVRKVFTDLNIAVQNTDENLEIPVEIAGSCTCTEAFEKQVHVSAKFCSPSSVVSQGRRNSQQSSNKYPTMK